MWKFIIVLIFGCCYGAMSRANLDQSKVQCACFNTTEPETCTNNKVTCDVEAGKIGGCFVVWANDNATGEETVTMKGCFISDSCNRTECIADSPPRSNINYCCCRGNMCNLKYKYVPLPPAPAELEEVVIPAPPSDKPNENLIIVIVACCAGVIVLASVGGFFLYRNRKAAMFNEVPTNEPDISSSSLTLNSPRPIHLIEQKARGRFGAVWRAQFKSDEVAVKIFPLQDKDSWQSEQEIFKLPRMRHPNILEYIGVEKHSETSEFWLITAYHSLGSLCDYLKAHTVTWTELCKIAESMARGLTHLHEEFPATKADGLKPAVAHRDFKSKNVLLKADLTACIADFGLALIFEPGKPCGETHGQVGTRRYMAPEVLEGAINFTRDAFLRIDVYACGLVLWELVSRCTEHDGIIPDYTLPFETELGIHPSVEEMQENVVTKKMRPRIPEHWRSHSGLNAICDTMEECWDHDAEARLSSSCVMERISQHTRYPATQLFIESNTDTLIKNRTVSM
ncbi:activin receptor type-2B isoform X2 [Bradysia coprophila]|uniref:activin receptor type-2B isoform X2 n=1 Tax=Bradysia coprophila TaxID=38358 RepID=UPI00187D91DD|nr:activin receptor type-2B isoform X2 [Bradysia coprophila]